MNPEPSDRSVSQRPRPRLIAGVYNYCDHWCERCVFQQQCRLYLDRRKYEAALAEGEEDVKRLEERDNEDEYQYEDDGLPPPSEAQKAEFLAILEAANNYKPTPEEQRKFQAAERRKRRLRNNHPLTIKGRAYMDAVLDIREPLAAMLSAVDDPLVSAAFEAITHHAALIRGKTHRATGGLIEDVNDTEGDVDDRDELQSDCNGCAKLLRVAIAESRDAWSVLFTTPALSAEGLPETMLERLEELDKEIQKYFPRAMAFVRPGFDDRVGGTEVER